MSESIFPEFDIDIPMSDVWKHLDDIPRDATPFVVQTTHTFRWTPYIDENKAKFAEGKYVQRINGVLGRWQHLDDRGNWVNCIPPKGVWKYE